MTFSTRVIEIAERGQRLFQRTDLFDRDGKSLILPEVRRLNAVEVTDTAEGAQLMALRLIGYLPLTQTITLNIVPKFPIPNLWDMLEIGDERFSNIIPTIRGYQADTKAAPMPMLIRSFCHFLNGILVDGLQRSYFSSQSTGYFRPRIEFAATVSRFLSRGNPIDTVSNVFEFGLDNPINRVVKSACVEVAKLTAQSDGDFVEERNILIEALATLQRVQTNSIKNLDPDIARSVSSRLRLNYSRLLQVYQLLMKGGGVAFTLAPHGNELPSFLFNLEEVFERFVRQTLAKGLRGDGVAVLDGNKHQGRLFEDNKSYPTKSDLVFRQKHKLLVGLGEVKYKPKIKEADRYQIISHVTAAKAPVGILFSPANDGESQKLERIGRLATGAQFYHYRVDLKTNIQVTQSKMVEDIKGVLPQPLVT